MHVPHTCYRRTDNRLQERAGLVYLLGLSDILPHKEGSAWVLNAQDHRVSTRKAPRLVAGSA